MIARSNIVVNNVTIPRGSHLRILKQEWSYTFGRPSFLVQDKATGFEWWSYMANLRWECEWPAYHRKVEQDGRASLLAYGLSPCCGAQIGTNNNTRFCQHCGKAENQW